MVADAVLRVVVGADFFRAITGFNLATAFGKNRGLLFVEFQFVKAGTKNAHGFGAILDLRFFVLLGDHQAAGDVGDAHGGVRGVDGLVAGTRGAEGVDPQVLGLDLDVDFVGFGKDGNGGGGSMRAALGFGVGNALDAMDTAFVF